MEEVETFIRETYTGQKDIDLELYSEYQKMQKWKKMQVERRMVQQSLGNTRSMSRNRYGSVDEHGYQKTADHSR